MSNKIKIVVMGQAGVGKSAIAQLIAQQLEELEFQVGLEFIQNEHARRSQDNLIAALEAMQHNVDIEIIEQSVFISEDI